MVNELKYSIPMDLEWQGAHWKLAAAILFNKGTRVNHYVSLVRMDDGWFKFDDDNVQRIKDRVVPIVLKNNKYGCAYGLIYNRQMS